MFKDSSNNNNKDRDFKEVETIIGQSVKVDGDFKSEGNVVVEGMVSGSITTQKNLRVGKGAEIKANVEANSAWVGGVITGNVKINENLELSSSAKINGDIETRTLVVSMGAVINGSVKMNEDQIPQPAENKENDKSQDS